MFRTHSQNILENIDTENHSFWSENHSLLKKPFIINFFSVFFYGRFWVWSLQNDKCICDNVEYALLKTARKQPIFFQKKTFCLVVFFFLFFLFLPSLCHTLSNTTFINFAAKLVSIIQWVDFFSFCSNALMLLFVNYFQSSHWLNFIDRIDFFFFAK